MKIVSARRSLVAALALFVLTSCASAVMGTGSMAGRGEHRQPTTATRVPSPSHTPHRTRQVKPAQPVHAGLFEADGHTYGVGMPIIVRFTGPVSDKRAFGQAVSVRVDGRAVHAAWDWEPSAAPWWRVEAYYRLAHFWPAHSRITVDAPINGLPAGPGRTFDDNLTLAMNIGAAHVSRVDASAGALHMTVHSDGRVVQTLPVSLGAATTPTYRGVKVVEEFDRVENMEGTPVPWSVRLTNSGEFVHAAPWNSEIGQANLSHGCTNLPLRTPSGSTGSRGSATSSSIPTRLAR